jgi:UDP-N-acetylmuramoyl-tripeptide--D-alanyl-D-alanine ligase
MFREFMIQDIAEMAGSTTRVPGRELVRGVSIHSKLTGPGDVFFALRGEHTDGHFHAREALAGGACALVVEKPVQPGKDIIVADTLYALGELARRYRRLFNPRTVAITGTNGKTTVKNIIGRTLNRRYRTLFSKKNYNSLIGLPLTIFELCGEEVFLVVEIGTSSHGEIKRLCDIAQPDFGVITNIGPGHLTGLGSIEGVRKEKVSLVTAIPADGFALVGEGVGEVGARNVHRFNGAMIDDVDLTENGSYFSYDGTRYYTPLLGKGNVYNCLAALCFMRELGRSVGDDFTEDVTATIGTIASGRGRMEPIHRGRVIVIDDTYNANPLSMKAALDFVSSLNRRRVCVLGDMLELGEQSSVLHHEIGRYAHSRCDLLLTNGTLARYYEGRYFTDKNKLVRYLMQRLTGNEVILVKASRGLRFETIVQDILKEI